MKKLICILLILPLFYANAQKGYSITYESSLLGYGTSMFEMRFIYNDSFSFCYYKSDYDSKLEKTNIFSKKLIHHALFTDKKKMISYHEVNFGGQKGYFVDTISTSVWRLYPGTKNIMGYVCKGALNVSPNNDSTLVWYNEGLGNGIGHITLTLHLKFNLGTPLEIFEKKNNIHLVAIRIDKGEYEFNLPKGDIFIGKETNNKAKKGYLFKRKVTN